jgi:hypothetical protein
VNTVNAAGECTSRMTCYSTVRSVQACGTVASLPPMHDTFQPVIALEVDQDNDICVARIYLEDFARSAKASIQRLAAALNHRTLRIHERLLPNREVGA